MSKSKTALIFIFLTVLLDVIGFGLIIPVVPALLEELTGLGMSDAAFYGGLLMVAFASMQFLFSPVMGELSDQFGRRPVLLLSLLGLGIDYLIHGFASSLTWLFIGRLLAGVTGASFTVAMAYVADVSTDEDKAKNFGLVGAAFGLGFIIGPSIGGIFGAIDIRLPFFIASGLAAANFIFGIFVLPESLDKSKRRKAEIKNMLPGVSLFKLSQYKGLGAFILALFIVEVAGQALPATWSFYTIEMYDWNESEIGWSLSFIGLMVAIAQGGLINISVKKFGERKVIIAGFILWSIGMTLFGFAKDPWLLYLFLIPYCLGGVAGPTLKSMISNNVPKEEQGSLQGSLTSMTSITTIIGPGIAAYLFHKFAGDTAPIYFPGAPYISSALLMILATILVTYSLNKLSPKEGI